MQLSTFWQVLIVVTLVLLVFGIRDVDVYWHQLRRELSSHLPVYSAETTEGREAEFIRDRPWARFPKTIVLVALLALSVAAWWLTK